MCALPTSMPGVQTGHLYQISRLVVQAAEWKPALDEIVQLMREILIFDNLVVYFSNAQNHSLDVMYARALGRGRGREADISWGEALALRINEQPRIILEEPREDTSENRLQRPYLLGIPLCISDHPLGAMILIRFGGPPFLQEDVDLSEFIGNQIGLLVERQMIQQINANLESRRQQMQLQDDFVSNISHELRSPLGFIKGYTTTLLRSDTTWDPKTQHEFLEIIDQETDHLQELISNLLDSSRLQSNQLVMRFQPVRLESLLNDMIAQARLHHPGLEIELIQKTRNLVPIYGDPRRLAQVFENLVNNAVKYAPGSKVTIKVEQDAEGALISVKDYGPGIPAHYHNSIFDRFFRVPESSQAHGSGLGLYICKQIVEAHSGKINVDSEPGIGTKFYIFLPYQQPDLPVE